MKIFDPEDYACKGRQTPFVYARFWGGILLFILACTVGGQGICFGGEVVHWLFVAGDKGIHLTCFSRRLIYSVAGLT